MRCLKGNCYCNCLCIEGYNGVGNEKKYTAGFFLRRYIFLLNVRYSISS